MTKTTRTKDEIIAEGAHRLQVVLYNEKANSEAYPDKVTPIDLSDYYDGDRGLRMNLGRWGAEIAERFNAQNTACHATFRPRTPELFAHWEIEVRAKEPDCGGNPKCKTHQGGKYNMTSKEECRQ